MVDNNDDAHSDLGYGVILPDDQLPEPQDSAQLVPHNEYSIEYEKYVDLALGARADAASFYLHGNAEAGIRLRNTTIKLEKYGKWLRVDSLALSKGEERPPAFDW